LEKKSRKSAVAASPRDQREKARNKSAMRAKIEEPGTLWLLSAFLMSAIFAGVWYGLVGIAITIAADIIRN
jgi:hypothetical protein